MFGRCFDFEVPRYLGASNEQVPRVGLKGDMHCATVRVHPICAERIGEHQNPGVQALGLPGSKQGALISREGQLHCGFGKVGRRLGSVFLG